MKTTILFLSLPLFAHAQSESALVRTVNADLAKQAAINLRTNTDIAILRTLCDSKGEDLWVENLGTTAVPKPLVKGCKEKPAPASATAPPPSPLPKSNPAPTPTH